MSKKIEIEKDNLKIFPSNIDGIVELPPSKSELIRVLIASMLAPELSVISGVSSLCDDVKATIGVIETFFKQSKDSFIIFDEMTNEIRIKGLNNFNFQAIEINCGESALLFRIFAILSSIFASKITLNGEGTLLNRNFNDIKRILEKSNINFQLKDNSLPLFINGQLENSNIEIDCSEGSQALTGLLFTLPLLKQNTILKVKNLKSKTYVDLTIKVLNQFGITIDRNEYVEFYFKGNQSYKAVNYKIEKDWSAASNFLVAGAIGGKIEINTLNLNSSQPDRIIMDVLNEVGASIEIINNRIIIKKNKLKCFKFNAEDTPDLFPALCALAVNCEGESEIIGINRLFNKESNRALTLLSEFTKLNGKLKIEGNSLFIENSELTGGTVNSHNDHRIAMALAIAAINSKQEVVIENYKATSKSYPNFFDEYLKIMR